MATIGDQIFAFLVMKIKAQTERWVQQALAKVEASNGLEELVLDIARRLVGDHGAELAAQKIRDIAEGFRGDTYDIEALTDLTAEELSKLAEVMQDLEADDVAKARRFTRHLGVALQAIKPLLITAVRAVL